MTDSPGIRPVLLIYFQQFRGTGHRARMGRLADVLSQDFEVVLLDGGPPEPRWPHVPGITLMPLTPLVRDASGVIRPWQSGLLIEAAMAQRRHTLVNLAQRLKPRVLIVEFYPFGRLNLEVEIRALIEAVRVRRSDALVLSSVRDIVDTGFSDGVSDGQRSQAAMAARLRHFDGVLIHGERSLFAPGDPCRQTGFAGLELSAVPVEFTGFIGPKPQEAPPAEPGGTCRGTVLSMGGGIDGRPLAEAVLTAWPQLRSRADAAQLLPLRLYTGPYLPRQDHEAVRSMCAELQVECRTFSEDYRHDLSRASLSISRFGYNTCMDLLAAGVPAIVAPAPTVIPNDQTPRARLFQRLGRVTVAAADRPEAILKAVDIALQGPRDFPAWRLDGAERTAAWIRERLARKVSSERWRSA